MTKISGTNCLVNRLKGKPANFTCVLVARIALRVAPLLRDILNAEDPSRRARIILPSFQVLAALNFAGSQLDQFGNLQQATKSAAIIGEKYIRTAYHKSNTSKSDGSRAFLEGRSAVITAKYAFHAIYFAAQAAVKSIAVHSDSASDDAMVALVAKAGNSAQKAVERANDYDDKWTKPKSENEKEVLEDAYIAEFWNAIESDIVHLEANDECDGSSTVAVERLSESPLWLDGIPVWADQRWSALKDQLPLAEKWDVWTDWYQDRLDGRLSIPELEIKRVNIADRFWESGPAQTNSKIASLKDPRADPPHDNDVEGLDPSSGSWGEYPIDDLLIRQENRTIHDVIRRIDKSSYVMDPDFQRDFIWPNDKQSKLIESVIMRIPLPVFYMAEDDEGRMVVVDGLQRLSTFKRFIKDELPLRLHARPELNGLRFSELPSKIQNRIEDCNLIFYIIDSKVPERARLDIFERVNGGVPLTRQQMRNCLFMGQATRFLKRESQSDIFLSATGRTLNRKTMRDREFVNRFCAFRLLGTARYNGDMDDFLARCLRRMNELEPAELTDLSEDFRRGLSNNFLLFERFAFRKHRPGETTRRVPNASFWDVMSTGLSRYEEQHVKACAEQVQEAVYSLLANEKFDTAITYGPNDASKVRTRFIMAQQALKEALGDFMD